MKIHFAVLILTFILMASGAPLEPKNGKQPIQGNESARKPYSLGQLSRMQVQDLRHINHEDHLKDLHQHELNRLAKPLFGYAGHLLEIREGAGAAARMYGGETGRIFSGRPQAHTHHLAHAGAQNGLHQLAAPLEAIRHAASKVGDHQLELFAQSFINSAKADPSLMEKAEHDVGRTLFQHMVGKETVYTRKQERRERHM